MYKVSRLQKCFEDKGFWGLSNNDSIELILTLGMPPSRAHLVAQRCQKNFQTLRGFLAASRRELADEGVPDSSLIFIDLLKTLPSEVIKQKLIRTHELSTSQEVYDYLDYSLRDLYYEVLKVIYLDSSNRVIQIEDLFKGSVNTCSIDPRLVTQNALEYNAVSLIFAHNHPSGNPEPSVTDKRLTRELVFIGMVIQIKVLDHVIIGHENHFSFAKAGLIQKYEDNFYNLKIKMTMQDMAKQTAPITYALCLLGCDLLSIFHLF